MCKAVLKKSVVNFSRNGIRQFSCNSLFPYIPADGLLKELTDILTLSPLNTVNIRPAVHLPTFFLHEYVHLQQISSCHFVLSREDL